MTNVMRLFIVIIIIQLFYASSITLITYALPSDSLNHVDVFSEVTNDIDLDTVSNDLQDAVDDQLDIPVIELGALVFYSGNILIDLLLNFFFAIPQMLGLMINGFMLLFNVDSYIFAIVQLFASVIVSVLYFIGLIQLLINIRGRGSVI